MHLNKKERVYKKKIFKHLKIKKKSKQKEWTSEIIKTEPYKQGGFKEVYSLIKNAVPLLSKIINKIVHAFQDCCKTLKEASYSFKEFGSICNGIKDT